MLDIHLRKLRARDEISAPEEAAIRAAACPEIRLPADTIAIRKGEELAASTLLLEGMMCRFKDLRNGERQITELHVAGDFVDLHSFSLKRLDHSILTLTECRIATVPHAKLSAITEQHPHLTRVYWFQTNLDAAIHREWELSLGRRTAIAKLAALFCELRIRLGIVGLAEEAAYSLPLTQLDLAECLGLTQIHVNRTLKELRERKLVEFRSGRVRIADLAGLAAVAEFDPAYLYLERRKR
ncbi:Crp/Fnr family transcriptional regulator [Sphingomonas sp. BIUV-7]|uniref:Crp/Fnr family transcriptional regulator n=1 Tax=Sphingomonas natans TaxID=3063330 RepID=A0ABT8Y774_9SPHN|nr:Crp/Fnr family transcriptional regulator [Sphingomonas sp. BIUV-7]MDO6414167.1 Crp/Fnr family transcriptional regulator [Sphingomonas sp. BIUV-7]